MKFFSKFHFVFNKFYHLLKFLIVFTFVFVFSVPAFAQPEEWFDYNFPEFPSGCNDYCVYFRDGNYYLVGQKGPADKRSYLSSSDLLVTGYGDVPVWRWYPSTSSEWVSYTNYVFDNELIDGGVSSSAIVYSSFDILDSVGSPVFFATPSATSTITSMYDTALVQNLARALRVGLIIVVSLMVSYAGLNLLLRVLRIYLPL